VKEPLLKHSRVIVSFVSVSLAAVLAGCGASAVQVPQNSKLLYYGYGNGFNGTRPIGNGRVFLVDETKGNHVIAVVAVASGQPVSFSNLPSEHKYRVYFEPDPTLTMPGTQPAQ
jgi:hypothetical protein